MQSNNSKSNDKIAIIIATIVVICIIAYIVYLFFSSNITLNSNILDNNSSSNNYDNVQAQKNNIPVEKEVVYKETEIASFTTTLYDNSENRIYNINKACQTLDGTTIKKGEEFSFNNTIGPMGEENGYRLATGFDADGKLIDIPAGGMCQISSTLYNAALISNLEITERHPHSRRVSYVPVDKDATIYYGQLDLKFVNNRKNDIKIMAQTDNYSITIKLYELEPSN